VKRAVWSYRRRGRIGRANGVRSRAGKRGAHSANGDGVVGVTLPAVPGRCLDGLNSWLEDQSELPESLVSAGLALAANVDARPTDAQLWGRYQASLEALGKAAAESAQSARASMADIYDLLDATNDAEFRRAERYRQAIAAGDEQEARRWEQMVPIGCVRGVHSFQRWPNHPEQCSDCGVSS
jgi:hypothetical protein